MSEKQQGQQIIRILQSIFSDLCQNPHPTLPSAATVKRRASVAVVIRISPCYNHWPSVDSGRIHDLDHFFGQPWVEHGQPEILFIKRTTREGDRWSSQIAFPGGKRDPQDADDRAVAVRETWEETGLDLDSFALYAGNLPQQVVPTPLGSKPLMVLCPYIFVLRQHEIPSLRLQPTEVASAYWVPIQNILSHHEWTVASEDISSRLARSKTRPTRWLLNANLGPMLFTAVNLVPTESLSSSNEAQDGTNVSPRGFGSLRHKQDAPLLLWGLTLGVLVDFLNLTPPHDVLKHWKYPTFAPLDVRFAIWLMTRTMRNRNQAKLLVLGGRSSIAKMLEGYYPIAQRAIHIVLRCRAALIVATIGLVA